MIDENNIQQVLRRASGIIPDSQFEVQDKLLSTSGTEHDIPKAYLEENEIRASMHWKSAKKLLELAGEDFKDAEKYLEETASLAINLTRGRQGINVTTVLGRAILPKRNNQGYDLTKNKIDIVPKQPNYQPETQPVQYYQPQ